MFNNATVFRAQKRCQSFPLTHDDDSDCVNMRWTSSCCALSALYHFPACCFYCDVFTSSFLIFPCRTSQIISHVSCRVFVLFYLKWIDKMHFLVCSNRWHRRSWRCCVHTKNLGRGIGSIIHRLSKLKYAGLHSLQLRNRSRLIFIC